MVTPISCRPGDTNPSDDTVCSDVTRVGVTRIGNWGVTPIFLKKKLTTFLVITVCQFCGVTPFLKKTTTFLHITVTFIDFTRVSPLEGCQSPRTFFTCQTSFVYNSLQICQQIFFYRSGVTPLDGVTRGVPPHPPVTPLTVCSGSGGPMSWCIPCFRAAEFQ